MEARWGGQVEITKKTNNADQVSYFLLLVVFAFFPMLLASVSDTAHYSCQIGGKIQNFVGLKTRNLRSRVLSGIVETTIMRKSHG